MTDVFAARWTAMDFTPAGMVAPDVSDDEKTQCREWIVYAEAAWRGQAFLYWQQIHAIGQFLDITLAALDDRVCGEEEQKDLFDPYTQAVEVFAIVFAGNRRAARTLVGVAIAVSERLPKTADLLREAVISPEMFVTVVDRTDIVDERGVMERVDDDLATALARAGHVSVKAAGQIADRIATTHDAEASRKRHEKAQRRKNVTQRDYAEGLGGIHVTADAEETRLAYEAVEAMVAGVCPNDPRTIGARRSAAAIACLRGLPFTCACPDKTTCTATLTDAQISERQARIIVHAVCRKSTLTGQDDQPGFLDGHGPISADHARDLTRRPDALVRDLDLDKLLTPHSAATATATATAAGPDASSRRSSGLHAGRGLDTMAGSVATGDNPAGTAAQHGADTEATGSPGPAAEIRPPDEHKHEHDHGDEQVDGHDHADGAGRAGSGRATDSGAAESSSTATDEQHRDTTNSTDSTGDDSGAHGAAPAAFLTGGAQPGDPYRPTAALDVLVRALFGTCTIPGCHQPAWCCELDHCEEYDQVCPASGGPTCLCNVNPKCQRHHLLKTHLGASNPADGWVDEQWIDDDGTVWTAITVHGMTFETRAPNQWLFPQLTGVRCAHQSQAPPEPGPHAPAGPGNEGGYTPRGGLRAATAYKHAWRRTERTRLRRERARAAEAAGPPPF
ncbi:DUF222 domain-containing protein [Gordonia sp. (in: high G+C Gram-positive bacteria)]|uniref:HNH endonuclease signature motif containing protein n=1 Tax=Gordonia sp. (in: high G+C Gram-positive bacteria) TaxID=84139 RepID=UPI003528FDFE